MQSAKVTGLPVNVNLTNLLGQNYLIDGATMVANDEQVL